MCASPTRRITWPPRLAVAAGAGRHTTRSLAGILPVALHWKDDNPGTGHPYLQATSVPASKSPVAFVDVVAHIQGAPVFQLLHTVPGVEPWFPTGRYELTLVVTGDGVKPRTRTFSLSLDGNGRVEFARMRWVNEVGAFRPCPTCRPAPPE